MNIQKFIQIFNYFKREKKNTSNLINIIIILHSINYMYSYSKDYSHGVCFFLLAWSD